MSEIITGTKAELDRAVGGACDQDRPAARKAPCEGIGSLSKAKDIAWVPVNLTPSAYAFIRKAEQLAARLTTNRARKPCWHPCSTKTPRPWQGLAYDCSPCGEGAPRLAPSASQRASARRRPDPASIGRQVDRSSLLQIGRTIKVMEGATPRTEPAMPSKSAGIIAYRKRRNLEILLVHPGEPFWRSKDLGVVDPQGEYAEEEDEETAARRGCR